MTNARVWRPGWSWYGRCTGGPPEPAPGRACSKAGTGGWDGTGAGGGEAQNLRVTQGATGSEDPLLRQ